MYIGMQSKLQRCDWPVKEGGRGSEKRSDVKTFSCEVAVTGEEAVLNFIIEPE